MYNFHACPSSVGIGPTYAWLLQATQRQLSGLCVGRARLSIRTRAIPRHMRVVAELVESWNKLCHCFPSPWIGAGRYVCRCIC